MHMHLLLKFKLKDVTVKMKRTTALGADNFARERFHILPLQVRLDSEKLDKQIISERLKSLLKNFPLRELQHDKNYLFTDYFFEDIDAIFEIDELENAPAVLRALLALKKEFHTEVTLVGKDNYHDLILNLLEKNLLLPEMHTQLDQAFKQIFSFDEYRESVEKNQNFHGALALARFYQSQYKKINANTQASDNLDSPSLPYKKCSDKTSFKLWWLAFSLQWLNNAFKFKPNYLELNQYINLDNFFAGFDRVNQQIMSEHLAYLMPSLQNNISIQALHFDDDWPSETAAKLSINASLADLLAKTNSIRALVFNIHDGLNEEDLKHIANALRTNTSVLRIDFCSTDLPKNAMLILLCALADNPKNKLQTISAKNILIDRKNIEAFVLASKENNKSVGGIGFFSAQFNLTLQAVKQLTPATKVAADINTAQTNLRSPRR